MDDIMIEVCKSMQRKQTKFKYQQIVEYQQIVNSRSSLTEKLRGGVYIVYIYCRNLD